MFDLKRVNFVAFLGILSIWFGLTMARTFDSWEIKLSYPIKSE